MAQITKAIIVHVASGTHRRILLFGLLLGFLGGAAGCETVRFMSLVLYRYAFGGVEHDLLG